MKKIVGIAILLFLVFAFTACAKNEAEDVKKMIDALPPAGAITLEDEEAIVSVREAYDALAQNDQNKVNNYMALRLAEAVIKSIKESSAALPVIALIDALPIELMLEDATAVAEAASAYEALSESEKKKVTNASTLKDALATIEILTKDSEDKEAAAAVVEAMINEIPEELTLKDKEAIASAEAAYEALSDAQKELVKNKARISLMFTKIQELEATKEMEEKLAPVNDAIALISQEVTLADKEAIEQALALYEALPEEEKVLIKDRERLIAASLSIVRLISIAEHVSFVVEEIEALEVSAALSKAHVRMVRIDYERLNDEEKAQVTNSALLARAEIKVGIA